MKFVFCSIFPSLCQMSKNQLLVTIQFYGLHEYLLQAKRKYHRIVNHQIKLSIQMHVYLNELCKSDDNDWICTLQYTEQLYNAYIISLLFMLSIFALNLHVTFVISPFWQRKKPDLFSLASFFFTFFFHFFQPVCF